MEQKEINRIIKNTKTKEKIVAGVLTILNLFIIINFDTPIKYLIAVLLVLITVIVVARINNVSYLLYKDCNPELYYAVATGLLKQVPLDKQAQVAEFIGDYKSAIELTNTLMGKSKNEYVRLSYLSNIVRLSFFAKDYALCKDSITKYKSLSQGKKSNKLIQKRLDYYSAFMEEDYALAKKYINEVADIPKRQANSFQCAMLYCKALCDYRLNDTDAANDKFNEIVLRFPHMYYAKSAKAYLDNTQEFNEPSFTNQSYTPSENDVNPTINKKELVKGGIALIVLLAVVFGFPAYFKNESKAETPSAAIQKYDDTTVTSINETVKIDGNYFICIFTSENIPGVAYLKKTDKKYECSIAECYENFPESDDSQSPPSKIHASGKTSDVVYKWIYNKQDIPKNYRFISLEINNKTVYFCYIIKEPKIHFFDLYSLDFNE